MQNIAYALGDAQYSLNIAPIKRSNGQNIVSSVAYITGLRLRNDSVERGYSQFSNDRDRVLATGLILPDHAPAWMRDREDLWNAVEKYNNRGNSQLGRRIMFAIPHEIPDSLWLHAVEAVSLELRDKYGVVVDWAIHNDKDGNNPHVHLITTDCETTTEGFGKKVREMGRKAFYYWARKTWERVGNHALELAGADKRLHSQSYSARGIARVPTKHRGIGHNRPPRAIEREPVVKREPVPQIVIENHERVREPSVMGTPTGAERLRYPNIARGATWLPQLDRNAPAQQQQEIARYYDDLKEKRRGDPEGITQEQEQALEAYDRDRMDELQERERAVPSMQDQTPEVQREYLEHERDGIENHLDRDDHEPQRSEPSSYMTLDERIQLRELLHKQRMQEDRQRRSSRDGVDEEQRLKEAYDRSDIEHFRKFAEIEMTLSRAFEDVEKARDNLALDMERVGTDRTLERLEESPSRYENTRGSLWTEKGREEWRDSKEALREIPEKLEELRQARDRAERDAAALERYRKENEYDRER